MRIEKVASILPGQDGAVWGDYLFRFDSDGTGWAFDARPLANARPEAPVQLPLLAQFHTDAADAVIPHFNAVAFGAEYYASGDEFPLLYANLYNNYSAEPDRREGVCCVYRLQRTPTSFTMTLVQVIRIGFVGDAALWCSGERGADVRPYGNFVVDREKGLLHAFVMRDVPHTTRYFTFALPKSDAGEYTQEYGVPTVTLEPQDILSYFDTDYHLYIQGACCHDGKICSSEGFNAEDPPALRLIDPVRQCQLEKADLVQLGYPDEAEWIDYYKGCCYYSDAPGNVYRIAFENS